MPGLPPTRTLFELLEWAAAVSPDHEAVVTKEVRLSYAEWRDAAVEVGAALTAHGIGSGDGVALLSDNRAEWLAVAAGAASVGARLVTLNTWAKAWDLEFMLGHAKPRILITIDRLGGQDFIGHLAKILPEAWELGPGRWRAAKVPSLEWLVVIGDQSPPGAARFRTWLGHEGGLSEPQASATPDDIAMVMFTSGSTARPKAVSLTHRHLIENGFEIGERQALTSEDRVFLASPLFWAYGGANALMAAMTHRSTLVLQSQFDPTEALATLESERCTSLYTLPAMTHALLDVDGFSPARLASVRTGLTIGPPEEVRLVAERLGVAGICNIYGSSETYGNCCVTPTDAPLERRLHSQGPPLPGVDLRICDPASGAPLPAGELGEILVRGRITPGYLEADGVPSPVVDEDGFFHTGDLGHVDGAGWVTFQGRLSEMIKTSGINVSPSEVEDFLIGHPDVQEVGVIGGGHPIRDEQVIAFVRLREGAETTVEELRAYCRDRIAGYKVPAVIREVTALPLTDTGKLARKELRGWADDVVADATSEGQ